MSTAPVEHPEYADEERPLTLLEEADQLMERNPGYRVEIIGGILTVTPPAGAPHSRVLNKIIRPFLAAGLDDGETEVHQGVGLWLPDGSEDYAIPDLCVVDADIDDHLVEFNCYDPVVFRLVLEVTSSNYNNDLRAKAAAYAQARIPVYVIVNRKHQRLHVLTEPVGGTYESHRVYAAGELATLPDSLGAKVTLDVDELLAAGRPQPRKQAVPPATDETSQA
ncbi:MULTISPECIES: Uma2 family endonuclease [unclassified Streptomyces]|uniref:Uma2 family endonuclease n=1 Tax=unclassified Streptomyces TaxID=2593676 RepID=UPI00224D1034|nr:Uma2 family endonuclease [Streptomyces sp. NBC_00047]MCX5606129.1 Uma2 family endonuclease [Streptomyces sp. NBC_00047]